MILQISLSSLHFDLSPLLFIAVCPSLISRESDEPPTDHKLCYWLVPKTRLYSKKTFLAEFEVRQSFWYAGQAMWAVTWEVEVVSPKVRESKRFC